ncbi:MAG TPA: isoprenylcysteine carboxylmethyltransferase family protein [archaeon]|nr:isoprenylcysteine carboxylmethyltransferase family protein [archaeon]
MLFDALFIFVLYYITLLVTYWVYLYYRKQRESFIESSKLFTNIIQLMFLAAILYLFFTTEQTILSIALGSTLAIGGLSLKILALQSWEESRRGMMKDGIYAIVRHPLYLGNMITYIGLSMILSVYGFVASLPLVPIFFLRGKNEEGMDRSYRSYKKEVSGYAPRVAKRRK